MVRVHIASTPWSVLQWQQMMGGPCGKPPSGRWQMCTQMYPKLHRLEMNTSRHTYMTQKAAAHVRPSTPQRYRNILSNWSRSGGFSSHFSKEPLIYPKACEAGWENQWMWNWFGGSHFSLSPMETPLNLRQNDEWNRKRQIRYWRENKKGHNRSPCRIMGWLCQKRKMDSQKVYSFHFLSHLFTFFVRCLELISWSETCLNVPSRAPLRKCSAFHATATQHTQSLWPQKRCVAYCECKKNWKRFRGHATSVYHMHPVALFTAFNVSFTISCNAHAILKSNLS